MVAKNPYIVKETDGNAYTIRQYVTGRPLTAGEMLPDEHGIYPVSPLGFGMSTDGAVMQEADPTAGMMTYPIYYGDMYGIPAPTPEEEGNIVPPEMLYGYVKYHLVGPYSMFTGAELKFPVLSVTVDETDPSVYVVTVTGDIRDCDDDSNTTGAVRFYNITTDDYEPTGLLHEDGFMIDSVSVVNGVSTIKITNQSSAPFSGIVGPGKLGMSVMYDNSGDGPNLVSIKDNTPDSANGIFLVGRLDGEPFRKVCELPEPEDSGEEPGEDIPECNARNGYGSSEVRDWITGRVGGVVGYGTHPSAFPGDLVGAGAFVQWFASCSDIDISAGMGGNQVIVPGFGLGSGYFQTCVTGERAPDSKQDTEVKHSQWLTFGYGTNHSDVLPNDHSKAALPRDWPFTDESDYGNTTVDNSITLIRKGAQVNGTVYGRLDRIDPECTRCSGYGTIINVDGQEVECPVCHGTGEVPECENCHGTGKVDDADCPECLGSGHSTECYNCDGTGEVNGFRCSICGGTGKVHGKNVAMNKVHVCLFNNFEPSNDDGGHTAGTTVLKKTFVNLATPINVKDGDEFEVTVSLPNISLDKAFQGTDTDDLKNLSGYYAYISQPRVYVMSGTWKFSETSVEFTVSNDLTKVKLSEEFLDSDGNPLTDGTEVRVKMSFGSYTSKDFDMTGVLAQVDGEPGIELYDTFDVDDNVKRMLTIPPTRKAPNRICGAAYVEPNNDTLPEGSTPLGLNAVRSEDGVLGPDYGEEDGGVEQYNKLYTVDNNDDKRHHVLFDDEGNPKEDKRQVVATVYPTVTNTFPWALTHRRKQNFLEKLMTMDAELGCNSIFAHVREMNRDILGTVESMGAKREYRYYMFEVSENEYMMHPDWYPDITDYWVCMLSKMTFSTSMGEMRPVSIIAENSNSKADNLFVDGYNHEPWVSGVMYPDGEVVPEGESGTGWFVMDFGMPVTLQSYELGPLYRDVGPCTNTDYANPRSWRLCGSNIRLTDPQDSRWFELDVHTEDTTLYWTCRDKMARFNINPPITAQDKINFTPYEYPIDMTYSRDYIATQYGSDVSDKLSFIGAALSVAQYETASSDIESQPVRQALKAVKMLSQDFRNSRVKWTDFLVNSNNSDIFSDDSPIDSSWDMTGIATIPVKTVNEYETMANKIRLSHLPEFIATAGTGITGEPISPLLAAYPYVGEDYSYYYSNPYGYGEYATVDKTEDTPCEVASNASTRVFSVNSIVTACTEKRIPWLQTTNAYDDLLRAAELSAINFNDVSLLRFHVYRTGKPWLEPIDAFTKILSPDNIPVPQPPRWKYEDVGLSEDQYAFIAGDAYGYYKLLNDWTSMSIDEFIATTMPTDDSLAEFLKEYVPSYGAGMTNRHWDGFRVKVTSEPTELQKKRVTFLTRMAWNGAECDDTYRGQYAADAFIIGDTYADPNLNRIEFTGMNWDDISMDYSVPPYSCRRDYSKYAPFATTEEQDAVGYVRVYMKFSFCADAGRWYCVDYRQAPISYLSPLYGAKALEEQIDGYDIWVPPSCGTFSWREAASHTYEEYRPMDINPVLVPEIASPRHVLTQNEAIAYVPTRNVTNSCVNGIVFEPIIGLYTYHVSLDLTWSNFDYLDYPDRFDCVFQGARHERATDQWVWTGVNDLCSALDTTVRPKTLILANPNGTYHYEADFTVSDSTMSTYDKFYVGLRTDYSNGRGRVEITNLTVTNMRNRLSLPYLPVSEGGLGLNAPLNKYGEPTTGYQDIAHANFWSVRPHLRPATGAVPVGDIPHYYRDDEMYKNYEEADGLMSDAVLWGQYDYPEKNMREYHLPDPIYPDADLAETHLAYAARNIAGVVGTGHIQLGRHPNFILGAAMPGDTTDPGPGPDSGEVISAGNGNVITVSDEENLGYH